MNLEFYKKQLEDLKRSNKNRKLKLAERYGYDTVEAYKAGLESSINSFSESVDAKNTLNKVSNVEALVKANKKVKKPIIHNVTILDNSGSMAGSKFNNAYKGIKDEVVGLKLSPDVEYLQTFCHFAMTRDVVITHKATPINTFVVPKLRADTGTPLYKSIVETLSYLINNYIDTHKYIIQIFTDGEDTEWNTQLEEAIKIVREAIRLGMTVTFIGTERDTKYIISKFGIDESNTLVHNNTGDGVKLAFATRSTAMESYTKKVLAGEDTLTGFFKTTETL